MVVSSIWNGVARIKDDENEVRKQCLHDDDEAFVRSLKQATKGDPEQ